MRSGVHLTVLALAGMAGAGPVLAAPRGELSIRSRTEGAQVYIDGQLIGTIPLERPLGLVPGQHALKILKRGYTDYLDVVTIRDRKLTALDVDLLPVLGVLRLYTQVDGARAYVDGHFVGEV